MFFKNLFKKKKLKFTAYTYFDFSKEMFPIQMARKIVPKGFSDLPLYHSGGDKVTCPFTKITQVIPNTKTIRHCDGIIDLWGNSMMLVAPFDLVINIKDNKVTFETMSKQYLKVAEHYPAQYDKMFPNYVNLKFVSPWKMFSNRGINCMFTPAFYHLDDSIRENIIIPPGVIDYKMGHDCNINFFVKKQFLQKVIHIKAGTPLIYITPMVDEPFEIETKLIDKETWDGKHRGFFSFKSNYKQYKQDKRRENLDN